MPVFDLRQCIAAAGQAGEPGQPACNSRALIGACRPFERCPWLVR